MAHKDNKTRYQNKCSNSVFCAIYWLDFGAIHALIAHMSSYYAIYLGDKQLPGWFLHEQTRIFHTI